MSRLGSSQIVGLLLVVPLLLAGAALAQDPAAAPADTAAAAAEPAPPTTVPVDLPVNPRIDAIMAATDSLSFSKTAGDSASLVPPLVVEEKSIFRTFEESKFGQTPIGQLFVRGGFFMWWLCIIAIYGLYFILDRAWTLNRAKVNTRRLVGTVITTLKTEGVQAAAEECQKWRGPVAAVMYSGLQRADRGDEAIDKAVSSSGVIEMSYLERGLGWISSVTTMAPLVGFLGTVTAMIRAFNEIAAAEQVTSDIVMSYVGEALLITGLGLILAVPAVLAYNAFVARIDKLTLEMEEAAAELIGALHGLR
jgi:biopolymer transport protein ExbB